MANINDIPINKEFSSRTNQVLLGTGTVLTMLWGFGTDLGISQEYLDYLDKGITILGLILGVKFRNDTTKKIEDFQNENNY